MDWILGEVLEDLKTLHNRMEKRIIRYSEYEDEFKGPLGTNDKFEAGKHEYWRGRMLEAIESKAALEDMIINIYSMIDEEADRDKEYSEEMSQLRGEARGEI